MAREALPSDRGRSSHEALGATLEATVVVLQSHQESSETNAVLITGPYPYPPVLAALKTTLCSQGVFDEPPPVLRRQEDTGGCKFFTGYSEFCRQNCRKSANLVLGILREPELFFELPSNSVSEPLEIFTIPCSVAGRRLGMVARARPIPRVDDHQCGFTPGTPDKVGWRLLPPGY
jgi:hypothetical protein